jgi:serine/threonine-protein kinase RsbT
MVVCVDEADRFLCARAAASVAMDAGLAMEACAEVALVASELASNAARHGGGGWLVARVVPGGVQLLCQDRGPGIDDVSQAVQDGWSKGRTAATHPPQGSLGAGLGTVLRLSDTVAFYRTRELGQTVVTFRGRGEK